MSDPEGRVTRVTAAVRGHVKAATRLVWNGLGLHRTDQRLKQRLGLHKVRMSHPPFGRAVEREVRAGIDLVRRASIALAVTRLQREGIAGDFAELGVFQGELSRFLAAIAPERRLHLFDTFAGFAADDAESQREARPDARFRDTSAEAVRRSLGRHAGQAVFHAGWFPDTVAELGDDEFAFVMLDLDKYKPTRAALEVFYPRLVRGAYLFLHDYNSPESDSGVSRALDEFLADKPELAVELPDCCGSVVVRKV